MNLLTPIDLAALAKKKSPQDAYREFCRKFSTAAAQMVADAFADSVAQLGVGGFVAGTKWPAEWLKGVNMMWDWGTPGDAPQSAVNAFCRPAPSLDAAAKTMGVEVSVGVNIRF